MVLDDLLDDMFDREERPKKHKKGREYEKDERKKRYDEDDEEEYYDDEKEDRSKGRGKKRGFFDRITELFD